MQVSSREPIDLNMYMVSVLRLRLPPPPLKNNYSNVICTRGPSLSHPANSL